MQSGMDKLNTNVNVNDISKGFSSGADPMDFINKNLRNGQPVNTTSNAASDAAANVVSNNGVVVSSSDAANVITQQSLSRPEAPRSPADLLNNSAKSEVQQAIDAFNEQQARLAAEQNGEKEAPKQEMVNVPEEEAGELNDPDKEKEGKGFLKNLRKKVTGLETEVQVKTEENNTYKERLEKIEKGEEVPEVFKTMQTRLKELEKLEKLYALDSSPEAQEMFVQPLNKSKAALDKLFKDYEVPSDVLEEVLGTESDRKINNILSEYMDPASVLETKGLLKEYKERQANWQNARKDADGALNKLLLQGSEMRERADRERIDEIKGLARTSWEEGMNEILATGKYPELTLKAGDEDHNKIARPILDGAAKEYGKVMNLLAAAGLKAIPKEAAKIIAKRFAYSEAVPVIAASRQHFWDELNGMIEKGQRKAKYDNPPLGGTANNPPTATPTGRQGVEAKEASNILLRGVGLPV